jgi:hypothetical protein
MLNRIAPVALLISSALVAKAPMQRVDVTTVQSADYSAGATVRIAGTAGELNIEAWDEPRVEATLTRSEYAGARERDGVKTGLERIALSVEKHGNDIAVELKAPSREFWARWLRGKTNATLECRVMVPRDAKLVVRHEDGSVMVYGVAGDIDASARFGDIVVQLADPGQYAIDARARAGGVYTDYEGQYRRRLPVGEKFMSEGSGGAHKITLRVRIGGIDIVKMSPVSASGS